ncbi:MAG: glycosyltransferase [Magnetococcus sp. MYC-9]
MISGKLRNETLQLLREQTGTQTDDHQALDNRTVRHALVGLLNVVLARQDQAFIIGAIEILRAAIPEFHAIFDWDAPTPALSLEKMRQLRPKNMPLVTNPLPPAGAPRVKHRVLIVLLKNYMMTAMRFVIAMDRYGWQTEICNELPLTEASAEGDCRIIAEICRQKKVDILLFDAPRFNFMGAAHPHYIAMKKQLQQEHPLLRVLGLSLDSSEGIEKFLLETMGDFFDGLLQCHHDPAAPHMRDNPHFRKKILHDHLIPFNDQNFGSTEKPLVPNLFFRGSIRHPHWARVLWLAAAGHVGLPVTQEVNQFLDTNDITRYDPSPAYRRWLLDDYATYMRKYTDATCCLSVLMFGNMARYLTGRSFEVLLSGALLVQEYSPLMHNHFIPGEHYLEFTTIAELVSIVHFMREHPEEAEEVRRRGHAFACERYNDVRIVGQIDKLLYFPEE